MNIRRKTPAVAATFLAACLGSTALTPTFAMAAPAAEENVQEFSIAPQSLQSALLEFSRQSQSPVVASTSLLSGLNAPAVQGRMDEAQALNTLLAGSGLYALRGSDGGWAISRKVTQAPQGGSAAGDGAEVEALIVTAQKREENIQDVPIAMSAFTQEQLDRSQVAGGPDLMTQVPNMTFTKTNFTTYSIQLRGIGTQAISATVDHAVAVAFNNTPFIRNRFFEQEFYDLQRVEVLRGPQGTLYGRNATAGVVNLISNKPKFGYEASLSGDIANYNSSRLAGMVNVPLVEDVVALRIAGAWTKREGYATNDITGNPIDGRDLWSTRTSLRFAPTDSLDINLIWEHFEEDDDRLRSGKQLCKTHNVTEITAVMPNVPGSTLYNGQTISFPTTQLQTLPLSGLSNLSAGVQATFSQGCEAASLYSPDSFQKPNGFSLPYYYALSILGLPRALDDPYVGGDQSHDLRAIESTVDPSYKAETDIVELQVNFDLTDHLRITSETGYGSDFIFSTQDYNRFNTEPGAWLGGPAAGRFFTRGIVDENGVFCDPQVGCSNRLVGVDLSTAKSRHFSQELRIGSSFDGPFNFSLGGNFLRYDTEDKYYVFVNSLSLYAAGQSGFADTTYIPSVTDNVRCLPYGMRPPEPDGSGLVGQGSPPSCMYIDPNPIGSLNDRGHNYFLSRNPYKLISYALFGETYYNFTDDLKLTTGLRWTVDKKEAPRVPSWLLAVETVGLVTAEVVEQEWNEPTGRLAIDWKPELAFTDETMVYASYAHGYKAGGMNPPAAALVCYAGCGDYVKGWNERQAAHPKQFDAEYVDAFELGSKNRLLDGSLTFNTAAFYYNYQGYQLSQIIDRAAITQNFDATVWGIEIEADWRPLENLRLGFKGGYEKTKVADGMRAIDVMDRTAGMPGWVVVSPFPTFPSNCVMPAWAYVGLLAGQPALTNLGFPGGGGPGGCELAFLQRNDPVTGLPYKPDPEASALQQLDFRPDYPGWNPLDQSQGHNFGEGFYTDLSGNELPNAPDYTATITADYTIPLPNDWLATLHTDLYMQSEAWTRIFNTEGYDKLKAYTNVNLAAIFTNEDAGWKIMAYVKNVFDRDSITGAFLNSDDTGLTTNIFLTDPRLYGLRVTKEWSGGPWWTGANPDHDGPFPLTVELGGQVQRHDAPYAPIVAEGMDVLPDNLDAIGRVQNRDLDWGDGRSVRLSYQPVGSPWSASAGVRYGRTNNETAHEHLEETTTHLVCGIPAPFAPFFPFSCNSGASNYAPQFTRPTVTEWSEGGARTREEHNIVDFQVGYDLGIGSMLSSSTVKAGIRYADLESTTNVTGDARYGFEFPIGWLFEGVGVTDYEADITAVRDFAGTGPALTWDAALPLLGSEDTGHLNLDWMLTGGVLFGQRKTAFMGFDSIQPTFQIPSPSDGITYPFTPIGEPTLVALPEGRQESVTAPLVELSVGLSYEMQRIKIGAGYRWERYFDVLDTGFSETEEGDRTIDGPYFKLAIGFGG